MKLGMELPQIGPTATATTVAEAATGAEAIGLDSVWVLDRVLRPVEFAESPLPASVLDPIETLTYAAALTTRVQLGTSAVIALPQPPVVLARRLATLDQLAGGRLIAGLVQGWMPQELAAGAVPMSRRGDGWDAYVGALRAVWGPDPVSYDVEPYAIPPSHIGPKPAGPMRIFMGYSSEAGIRRAARIADGLLPYQHDLATLRAHIELFRSSATEAGRDATTLPVVARVSATPTPGDALLNGPVSRWVDDLGALAELGVDHVLVGLGAMPVADQLTMLAELKAALSGHVGVPYGS